MRAMVMPMAVLLIAGCAPRDAACLAPEASARGEGMRWVPAGRYLLGGPALRGEEGPERLVALPGFWIGRTEVTNAQFARFVAATGYRTLAERAPDPRAYPGVPAARLLPSSLVFVGLGEGGPWRIVPGADWRHPEGPGSSLAGRANLPVVHIGHEDARAYARWAGGDLPSEDEWEVAARGGLSRQRYSWGGAPPGGEGGAAPRANLWQGAFPIEDKGGDGYRARLAPVGCFAPNGYGLYDMAGNVWEWTRSPVPPAMRGGADRGAHLIKGGSYLCADNYCYRYRPAARSAGPADGGASHIGFRIVRRSRPQVPVSSGERRRLVARAP